MRGSSSSRLRRHYATIRTMNATSTSTSSGWNRGTSTPKPAPKKPSPIRGIVAGLVVVALGAGIVAWLFKSGEAESLPLQEKKPSQIKTVTPAPAPKAEPVKTNKAEEAKPEKEPEPVPFKVITNGNTLVERFALPNGRYWERHRLAKPPLFKHATDDLLCMAVLTDGKNATPPMPISTITDEDFLNSLKDPIVINDDDDDKVKEVKAAIRDARQSVKEMMDSGLSFREILADHEKLLNDNREIRNQAMAELQKIHEEGDAEGERQYMLKINLALQQMGIPELDEPKTREERKAERAARRAERELQQGEQQ